MTNILMRPCLPSVTVLRHCSRWVLPRGTRWASSLSNSQEITPSSPGISQTSSPLDAHSARHDRLTFEDLGLHPPIIASLQAAFPHVRYPTDVQARFIPAILEGKDVLLKDVTGSGKYVANIAGNVNRANLDRLRSFGLTLALLNKPRLVSLNKREEKVRHITSLVLVPHRELGLQLMHWIERMVNAGDPAPPLASIAQLLIRDDKMHLTSGVHMLEEVAPHMLIGTPQAVMDVYERHPKLLQLDTLSTVVVDEVDYLVETPSRKDPGKSFKKAAEKAKRKLLAHPGPTRHLLNTIYSRRIEVNQRRNDEAGWEIEKRRSGLPSDTMMPPSPQLVVSSATLRTHLRDYLYNESGWLDRDRVVKISGSGNRPAEMVRRGDGAKEVDNASIMHSVLLVSENRVRNIPGAVTTDSRPASSIEEVPANDSTDEVEYEIDPAQVQSGSSPCQIESSVAHSFVFFRVLNHQIPVQSVHDGSHRRCLCCRCSLDCPPSSTVVKLSDASRVGASGAGRERSRAGSAVRGERTITFGEWRRSEEREPDVACINACDNPRD